MSKGGQQTSQQGPDQFDNAARQQLWNQATQVASQPYRPYQGQTVAGPSSEYMAGIDTTNGLGNAFGSLAGQLGFGTTPFSGDAIAPYMNPYQSNVISATQANFDRQRALAGQSADAEATMAGAFGGSRGDILKAQALNDVNQNENATLANLNQSGYNNAVQNFFGDRNYAANLGLSGLSGLEHVANAQGSAGQYLTQLGQDQLNSEQNQYQQGQQFPYQQLSLLSQILGGLPMGGFSTTPTQGSPIAGAAGGALAGAKIGSAVPGVGTVAGGILGGLGGLFG